MGQEVSKSKSSKRQKDKATDADAPSKSAAAKSAAADQPVTPTAAEGGDTRKDSQTAVRSPLGMTPGMFIQQQEGVFSERYQGLKVLGKGSFGEVILCRDRITNNECAVKVLSKKALKRGADPQSLLREVDLLKQLDHPNIMKLFEFFQDTGYFYLVGEVYNGGELFDEIISRKRLSEADAARIIKQVLSGIAYMHRNKIVHRDLKPENLLLESKKKDAAIKIIDFGLSTHFEPTEGKKMKDKIGTAYYIAPEVLRGTYDEKCDVWSSGVILYILLSGCPPFYGSTEVEILKRVEQGKYSFNLPQWRKVSESAKDLIRKMLTYSPTTRCTALEALEHEWLRSMTDTTLSELPALEATMQNMKQFQGHQRLAQAAMLYMGSKLTTAEETKELTDIFRKLDKNGDGQLDAGELKAGYVELMKMKGVDITKLDEDSIEAEVDAVLQNIDFDNNGFIEYSEFVTVTMGRKTLLSGERLQRAFQMFDTDGSGKISSDEIAKIFELGEVEKAEVDRIISDADKNNDGEVDYEEFCNLLATLTANPGT